ncbi:MAG: hypothetical protein K2P59_00315 [Acetatifactor sp.]|nr:hypothetical protein [Acetatifactor sp.]
MKRTGKILWGLGFLLAACLLVIGNLCGIRALEILIMLAMLVLFITGLIHRNFILILLSAAVILVLNGDRLGLPEISTWTVLAAALLGGIGLNVLFPRRRKQCMKPKNVYEKCGGSSGTCGSRSGGHRMGVEEIVQTDSKQEVRLENNFGQTVKYLTGELPGQVRLENNFGSMTVYFDTATGSNHAGCVHAQASFGNIILNIPAAWNVIIREQTVFGSIREKGQCDPDGAVTLEIRAEASFGEIEIRYI